MSTLSTDHVRVEVAFDSTALSTPTWTDVSTYVREISETLRGRDAPDPTPCGTGTAGFSLNDPDGRFDPELTTLYIGKIRQNRQVRISLRASSADAWTPVHYGYVDSWRVTHPGGGTFSVIEVRTSDRFKLLARRTNTSPPSTPTVEEQAHLRLVAILNNGDTNGPGSIALTSEYSLNPDGYACRTLVSHQYEQANTLSNCQEAAVSDGGAFFVAGSGILTFQGTRFRTDNARATTSQGTFGATTGAVPVVSESLEPTVDEEWLANSVSIGTGDAGQVTAEDAAGILRDGRVELDLGATLLRALDAPDRLADVLAIRADPGPTIELVIDAWKNDAGQRAHALAREFSDRITVNYLPPGATVGSSRPYFIESVRHEVRPAFWRVTFRLSSAGPATFVDVDGVAIP